MDILIAFDAKKRNGTMSVDDAFEKSQQAKCYMQAGMGAWFLSFVILGVMVSDSFFLLALATVAAIILSRGYEKETQRLHQERADKLRSLRACLDLHKRQHNRDAVQGNVLLNEIAQYLRWTARNLTVGPLLWSPLVMLALTAVVLTKFTDPLSLAVHKSGTVGMIAFALAGSLLAGFAAIHSSDVSTSCMKWLLVFMKKPESATQGTENAIGLSVRMEDEGQCPLDLVLYGDQDMAGWLGGGGVVIPANHIRTGQVGMLLNG